MLARPFIIAGKVGKSTEIIYKNIALHNCLKSI